MRLLIGVACANLSDAAMHYQGVDLSAGAENVYEWVVGVGLILCLTQDIIALFRRGTCEPS